MFPNSYFAPSFFPPLYFPDAVAVVGTRPPYFPHGHFAKAFFPDFYFPGSDLAAPPIPPTPAQGGGGPLRPPLSLDVHARSIRLFVHPFDLKIRGSAAAADIVGTRLDVSMATFESLLRGAVTAAQIRALSVELGLPSAYLIAIGASLKSAASRNRAVNDDDDHLDDWWVTVTH